MAGLLYACVADILDMGGWVGGQDRHSLLVCMCVVMCGVHDRPSLCNEGCVCLAQL